MQMIPFYTLSRLLLRLFLELHLISEQLTLNNSLNALRLLVSELNIHLPSFNRWE